MILRNHTLGEIIKKIALLVFLMLASATPGFASDIAHITLAELQAKADIVVMAKVTKVVTQQARCSRRQIR